MKTVVSPGRESSAEGTARSRPQDGSRFGRNSGGLHGKGEGGRGECKERNRSGKQLRPQKSLRVHKGVRHRAAFERLFF